MNLMVLEKQSNQLTIDSREVAEMIGKRHDHLLRDITGYVEILQKSNAPNFGVVDFFIPSTYADTQVYIINRLKKELEQRAIGE